MEEERRVRRMRLSPTVLTALPSVTTTNIAATAPLSIPHVHPRPVSDNLERKHSSYPIVTTNPLPSSIYLAAAIACLLTRYAGAAECPLFSDIEHGTVSYLHTENNTGAHFICDLDYGVVGNDYIECLPGGNWNDTAPECKLIVCESLPTIPNGQVQHTGTTVGSKATYVCIKGFRMVGDGERECLGNSTWTGTQPECKRIVCKHPGTPSHGTASPADITDYPTGTKITYKCVDGYNIVGSMTTVCSEEGSWTTPIPTCKVTDCGTPPNISHATPIYGSTILGQPVAYECEEGYMSESKILLICISTGNWSGALNPCVEVITTTVYASKNSSGLSTVNQESNNTAPSSSPSSFSSSVSLPNQAITPLTSSTFSERQSSISSTLGSPQPTPSSEKTASTSAQSSSHVSDGSSQVLASSTTEPNFQSNKPGDDDGSSPRTDPPLTSTIKITARPNPDQSQTRPVITVSPEVTANADSLGTLTAVSKTSPQAAYDMPSSTAATVESYASMSRGATGALSSLSTSESVEKETSETSLKLYDSTVSHQVIPKTDFTTIIPMATTTYMSGVRIGIIIGIVVGALLPIIFIIVCTIILCKRKRSRGVYEVRFSNNTKDETSIIIEPAKPANHSNGHLVSNGHDNHVSVWADEGYTSHFSSSDNTRNKQLRAENSRKDVMKDPNCNDDTVVHIPPVHGSHERTSAIRGLDRQTMSECLSGKDNSPKTIQLTNLTAL